jgi:hypothetical protein
MPGVAIVEFDTPGRLRDLPLGSPFYAEWRAVLQGLITPRVPLSGPGSSVDPSRVDLEIRERRTKTWTGFPRPLLMEHRDDRAAAFAAGEDRDVQIEYLEWHVTRVGDTITKVVFVTETPEYWRAVARADRQVLLGMYREYVSPDVTMEDLFPGGGDYEPRNRWNTTDGIAHFIMRINSMKDLLGVSEELQNARDARDAYDTVPYARMTGADARLSFDTWSMTRKSLSVGTDDPPGLYIVDWDDTGWTTPDGCPVRNYWTVVRGTRGAALRLQYEVPGSEGFAVGDIRIGGRRVTTGGQLAEHVTVSAHTVAGRETS